MNFTRLFATLAFAVCASASADTITVTWNSPVFNPASVDVGLVSFPGGQSNTNAGRFEGTVTATTGISTSELYASAADFFAYCHDLSQTLTNTTYTVSYGASAPMLDFLGAVNSVLGGGAFAWLSPASSTIAAAVQLGIWEALHNDDFVLDTGNVFFDLANVPNAVETQFSAFVAAMAGAASLSPDFVMVLTSERTQDVITGRRPSLLIPEPGTIALVGFAVAAALLARRRRR